MIDDKEDIDVFINSFSEPEKPKPKTKEQKLLEEIKRFINSLEVKENGYENEKRHTY